MGKSRSLGAAEFKAKCLELLDDVADTGTEYVVTKRGRPVARVVPIVVPRGASYGSWKGKMQIVGNIVHTDWSDEFEINGPAEPPKSRRGAR